MSNQSWTHVAVWNMAWHGTLYLIPSHLITKQELSELDGYDDKTNRYDDKPSVLTKFYEGKFSEFKVDFFDRQKVHGPSVVRRQCHFWSKRC